ncbi:MAG: hypothetical protein AB1689_00130, partial [Thermodesulfobacteriota bacterium]
ADAPAQSAAAPAAHAPATGAEQAYSVQLHVHGSFSEGVGSIDSHSHEATEVGADVVWWSDHDFRITSHGHVSTFGFEDWTEAMPEDGSVVVRRGKRRRRVKELVADPAHSTARGEATFVADDPREGARSLLLRATGEGGDDGTFAAYRVALQADRGLFKRPLASEVTLELSVFAASLGPDARAFVEIAMSEHAPREGLPLAVYRVRYVLGDPDARPVREGTTFVVPLPCRPGEWNDLALPVSRDAVRGFPFIHGEDNSLGTIYLGVEARRGATAAARFDDLRIVQGISGPQVFARQRGLIDAVARDYPRLRQLQGVEVSWLGHHLNEFSVDTRLVDYDALLAGEAGAKGQERRDRITRRIVDEIHARGGLVSYNHMFGAMMEGSPARWTREEVLDELSAQRVFGADILEVGYRDRGGHALADHLWVWDELARRGLFLVGTGVSDSHGGPEQRWRTDANNFVSWIYARSPDKADLLDGLRAGRVFFGDLVLFDGTLDLTTARGARMGQIVVTDRASEELTVRLDGLAPGDEVRLLVSGVEVARWTASSPALVATQAVALDATRPTVARVEVHAADGAAKVFSNPITFVREEPAGDRLGARLVRGAR